MSILKIIRLKPTKGGIMKAKYVLLFVLVLQLSLIAQSKNYFVPKSFRDAVEKGTRSWDGKPGKNYWENKTDYKIKAELHPELATVTGHAWITYYNNSPDTLKNLVMRLYQDIFKKGAARDFPGPEMDLTDGVKIDTLLFEGVSIKDDMKKFRVFKTSTNLIIGKLPEPIAPGASAKIETRWEIKIPKYARLRMGAYSDSTFYVAYWYPQVAVYDDIDGWDRNEYQGLTEFYNDKNNFDIEITVPGDYLVWAGGELQNGKEVLNPDVFDRLEKSKTSDVVINVVTKDDLENKKVTNNKEKNVWKFIASGTPDITFAASSGYVWDALSTVVDNKTGRRTAIDAVYPFGNKNQDMVAAFAKSAINYLSMEYPGVPYPYPKMTVFNGDPNGGGGMESPMMVNNGTYESLAGQLGVTVHEIAHTYFPFFMGTNERKYAWMDEGWAAFLTFDLVRRYDAKEDEYPDFVKGFETALATENMLPPMITSHQGRGPGYGVVAYQHGSLSYEMLRELLGEDLFKKGLKEYIERWNGKHPIPYDFFNTFDNVSGQDLSWFWKPWYFEKILPDLAIKEVKQSDNSVVVSNESGLPLPVSLNVIYADGSEEKIDKPLSVWKDAKIITLQLDKNKKIKSLILGSELIPDSFKENNKYEVK